MSKIKKRLKMIGIGIGGILLLLILVVIVFINTSPQFGGKADAIDKKRYSNSQNYEKGKFHNIGHVKMNMSLGDMAKAIGGMFKSIPNTAPKENLEVERVNKDEIVTYKGETRFIWFGHSSFLLQMDTKNILIDPMFGDVPAPNKYLGPSRFSKEMPIEIDELPKIDAVLLSHDHYDHLDYGSILRLKEKVSMFYVPLGLGNHLEEWGVSAHKIVELDWWEDRKFGVFTFRCTPAQHFSGRGLTDRAKTLWCSWVIEGKNETIYFSGDSGYGAHFKEIGDKFGPFDFAMLECGQYNELWPEIHMFPEETAQAGFDLKAAKIMPIHWGAFKLAQHTWTDPIERVVARAKLLNISLIAPQIGEIVRINEPVPPLDFWWKE